MNNNKPSNYSEVVTPELVKCNKYAAINLETVPNEVKPLFVELNRLELTGWAAHKEVTRNEYNKFYKFCQKNGRVTNIANMEVARYDSMAGTLTTRITRGKYFVTYASNAGLVAEILGI